MGSDHTVFGFLTILALWHPFSLILLFHQHFKVLLLALGIKLPISDQPQLFEQTPSHLFRPIFSRPDSPVSPKFKPERLLRPFSSRLPSYSCNFPKVLSSHSRHILPSCPTWPFKKRNFKLPGPQRNVTNVLAWHTSSQWPIKHKKRNFKMITRKYKCPNVLNYIYPTTT